MRRPACIFAAIAFVLILFGTLMPDAQKDDMLGFFPPQWHVEKVGHFLGFALYAGSLLRCGAPPLLTAASAVLLASLTEWLQQFVEGRTPLVSDVFIDSAGALLGMAAAWWLRRLVAPNQNAQ